MDFKRIINRDGYRYRDLTKEDKRVIDGLNLALEDVDSFMADADYEMILEDKEATILEKMEAEISIKTMNDYKEYLKSTIAEYQVYLIEKQIREDEGNV